VHQLQAAQVALTTSLQEGPVSEESGHLQNLLLQSQLQQQPLHLIQNLPPP
jgi:hypothetical protein